MSKAPEHPEAAREAAPLTGSTRVVVRTTSWVRDAEGLPPAANGSRCGACGYDLSGSTSVTCPECGKQLGGFVPEPKRPPLGAFLVLCTTAFSLATIALLVFGFAGLVGAIDGPSRAIGAVCIVLALASGVLVRWLVHRPEGYPDARPKSERVLMWLSLGLPAAIIVCMVAVLAYVVIAMLVRAFVQVALPIQPRALGGVAVTITVVGVLLATVRSLRR